MLIISGVTASDIPGFKYNEIKEKSKISYNSANGHWSTKVNKKEDLYFTKTKGFGTYFDYLTSNKSYAFTTDCEYEFIAGNLFIGYSNKDLKFYTFSYNGSLLKRELSDDEVKSLFPDYQIIKISEFSDKTNSLKIKKAWGDLRIILLNDTDKSFDNYTFSSGNAKIETYPISGLLTVSKPGMIQFSNSYGTSKENPWYVLLVR